MARAQQTEDLLHVGVGLNLRRKIEAVSDVRMMTDACDLLRYARRRENEIDTAGGDRACRHAIVFGGSWFLGKGDARFPFDRCQAEGSIGSSPG